MVEGITSDLIQLLMDREQYTLPQAVETVYGSSIYLALQRPSSGLYARVLVMFMNICRRN